MNRFHFVSDHSDTYPVKRLCQVIDIARSSYYVWIGAADTRAARAAADVELAEKIHAVHADDNTYGRPRITAEINHGQPAGKRVNHKRIGRVMCENNIEGVRLRRRHRTTIAEPADTPAADLLSSDFTSGRTEHPIRRRHHLMSESDQFRHAQGDWREVPEISPIRAHRTRRERFEGRSTDPRRPCRCGVPRRSRKSVHLKGFRIVVQETGCHAIDGNGGHERGQCPGRVVQRDTQTGDPARRIPLGITPGSAAGGVPVDHPLQHSATALVL